MFTTPLLLAVLQPRFDQDEVGAAHDQEGGFILDQEGKPIQDQTGDPAG